MSATRTGSRPDPSILGCETVRKQFPEDFGPAPTPQVVIQQQGDAAVVKRMKGGAQAEARINAEASELSKKSDDYAQKLTDHFPGVLDEASYIEAMSRVVKGKGFNPTTSINLVSTCRDEICRPFTETLDSMWGEHFNIASLGGFVFCGKTGFGAGMAHSPVSDGKERYIFWVGPHIAFGTEGAAGKIWRPGREGISSACGALIALNGEIEGGKLSHGLDPTDIEMSHLREKIVGNLNYGEVPNLVGITYTAHDCILEQVRATAKLAAPANSEYIIISGIQVHGALDKNMWWPGSITHYADGVETDLGAAFEKSVADYELSDWLKGAAKAHLENAPNKRLDGIFADVV